MHEQVGQCRRILYYDCFSGISGDMNLAAMLGLGVEPDYLRGELAKLGMAEEFECTISTATRKGITGIQVHIAPPGGTSRGRPSHCRRLADIQAIIGQSELAEPVKRTSLAMFHRLAMAEAHIHGQDIDDVHFHEVGATDAIIDIVGAAICFHHLAPDEVWCSAIELGGGFITCDHGILPVPAPAVVEILKGFPVSRGAVATETTTPTGAAILAALTSRCPLAPAFILRRTAYGIGHRDNAIPNVLRVQLADLPVSWAASCQRASDSLPASIEEEKDVH